MPDGSALQVHLLPIAKGISTLCASGDNYYDGDDHDDDYGEDDGDGDGTSGQVIMMITRWSEYEEVGLKITRYDGDIKKKHRKSAKLPWHHNIKLSFWFFSFVFLFFCLMSFRFFVI